MYVLFKKKKKVSGSSKFFENYQRLSRIFRIIVTIIVQFLEFSEHLRFSARNF